MVEDVMGKIVPLEMHFGRTYCRTDGELVVHLLYSSVLICVSHQAGPANAKSGTCMVCWCAGHTLAVICIYHLSLSICQCTYTHTSIGFIQ